MQINFIKMHGCGNDFLIIDNRNIMLKFTPEQVKNLADYKKSVGFDQLLLIENSSSADAAIRIYNSDGSEASACGNGSRCIAKLILEETGNSSITISTANRILTAKRQDHLIAINMGQAKLIDNYVEIGNSHVVISTDNLDVLNISEAGPLATKNQTFSNKLNVNFVQVINRELIHLRTFEHGVGATLACGSGACASFFYLYKNGIVNDNITIRQPGGIVKVSIQDDNIILAGDAETSYHGFFNYYT